MLVHISNNRNKGTSTKRNNSMEHIHTFQMSNVDNKVFDKKKCNKKGICFAEVEDGFRWANCSHWEKILYIDNIIYR